MYKIIFLLSCLFCSNVFAQLNDNTGSKISTQQADQILQHHNKVRQEVGAPSLIWNNQLATYAQNWADHLVKNNNCTMKHRTNPGEEGKPYGENIFWGSSSSYYKPIDASIAWYDEKKLYKYQKLNNNNWHKAGHYTQMVWKDTKEVGVGVGVCPNGWLIVVANYYPVGNVITQYPY
jgi:uncharacterized protein YkwD